MVEHGRSIPMESFSTAASADRTYLDLPRVLGYYVLVLALVRLISTHITRIMSALASRSLLEWRMPWS